MKPASAVPTASIASPEAVDELIDKAAALGLKLSRKREHARQLFKAVDEYDQSRDHDRKRPGFTETIKAFEAIERSLRKSASLLGDMKSLAIQRLEQDVHFPARGPVVEKLEQMSEAAKLHRERLIAARKRAKKPVPHDPHILKLVQVAYEIYQAAGGAGLGAWRDSYGDQGHAGRLIDLIKFAFELGPDIDREPDAKTFPGNTPIANALEKIGKASTPHSK